MGKKIMPPPRENLLDRERVPERIQNDLGEPVSYLAELSDFGVALLKRSFHGSKRETLDIVLLPVLFRQVLAFLDGVHLHLLNGAVYTAVPDLRAMFEATLSLEWILKGPADKKETRDDWKQRWAGQYYVSELRQERNWNRAFIPRTPDHARLKKVAPDLVSHMLNDPQRLVAAKGRVKGIGQHISRYPDLKQINSLFGPLAKKLGREPAWYRPGGPSSVGDLARRLHRGDAYQVLYRQWSEVSHGSRTKPHIQIHSGGKLLIQPIRSIDGLDQVLSLGGTIAERAIHLILREYRPGEIQQFARKRQTDWKGKLQIPEIKVELKMIDTV